MQYTDNYSLRKPQNAETAKVSDLNYNADQIDGIMADDRQISLAMYVSGNTYNTGDIVGYENPSTHRIRAYRCLADNVTGTWDSTKWTLTNLAAEIIDAKQSGGTEVVANPTGTPSDTMHTVGIDDVIYEVGGDSANQNIADAFSELQTYAVGDYCIYESILYKCTTAVSTAGAWDSTKWTSCVVTDEMGSGGGVTYNELKQLEYDALTPAEKNNGELYFITDTNGDEDVFQPIIYSETEREIGVFTDGKPLYQKTIIITTSPTYDAWNTVPCGDVYIVDIEGIYVRTNNAVDYFTYYESATAGLYVSQRADNIAYKVTSAYSTNFQKIIFTIKYTKTADAAGSGTWTPQGVPAVHYSTDEHVVGTWIDGKTLYEKTISFTVPSNSYDYFDTNITNYGTCISYEGVIVTEDNSVLNVNFNRYDTMDKTFYTAMLSDSRFFFRTYTAYSNAIAYITLRYTKSTS